MDTMMSHHQWSHNPRRLTSQPHSQLHEPIESVELRYTGSDAGLGGGDELLDGLGGALCYDFVSVCVCVFACVV